MPSYQVEILPANTAPTEYAGPWNDLWLRSGTASPAARAEATATWLQHFAAGERRETLVVRDGTHWRALLPIVAGRWGKLIPAGGLPRNAWCEAGDLLVDPTSDLGALSRTLWDGLAARPWPLYRFSFVHPQQPGWRSLLQVMTELGVTGDQRKMFEVPMLPCDSPWEQTWGALSKNFRKSLRRAERRLQARGQLDFQFQTPASSEENQRWLTTALAIEDSGWKGQCGSSVSRQIDVESFVRRLTDVLTASGHVAYAWLTLNGQPIAFELLWRDDHTVHGFKVGYHQQFSREQPGNVLLWYLLRYLANHTTTEAYDCIGPLTPGLARWPCSTRPVLRVTAAPRHLLGSTLITLYRSCWRPSEPRVEHASLYGLRGTRLSRAP